MNPIGYGSRGMIRGFAVAALAAALALSAGQFGPAAAQQPAPSATTKLEPLDIVTSTGTHHFQVEVMRTEPELEQGLMYRRFMPADHGMLFDFKAEAPVTMWMKNTYLSLDMVFMSRSGAVTNIAADREPLSERIIPSEGPVYAVLELNAGAAKTIGLKIGDQVNNELFTAAR